MKLRAKYVRNVMRFAFPARTSRDTLFEKSSWFVMLENQVNCLAGIGECTLINGLSIDNQDFFEMKIAKTCQFINENNYYDDSDLQMYPGIRFGFETALNDLKNGGRRLIFDNPFYQGNQSIPINGLVWMGTFEEMEKQFREKIEAGYNCIKVKVGALNFQDEYRFLKRMRKEYGDDFILRLDANGAFLPQEAEEKIKYLSDLHVHSIEQPVKAGQHESLAYLCSLKIIDIALDEELIGIAEKEQKRKLLFDIKPQYIVLKPSLLGGFTECDEWIKLAEQSQTGWWITSALESNVGLNAIAQWTAGYHPAIHQGLGTGNIYSNNIVSPLRVKEGNLYSDPDGFWDFSAIFE